MSKIKELLEDVPNNAPKKVDALASALIIKDMLENGARFLKVKIDETGEPCKIKPLTNIKTILYYCFDNINRVLEGKGVDTIILVKNSEMEDVGIFAFDENGEKMLLIVKEETILSLDKGEEVLKALKGDDKDVPK